jgi:serine/threonine protein kinase
VLRQVSHAIEFMHDSDIIHRDIKPENILFHEVLRY